MFTIEILSSNTPEASACDGVFASATFKVLSTPSNEPISQEEMQNGLWGWCDDCQLNKWGYLKGSEVQAGEFLLIDLDAPEKGEVIELTVSEPLSVQGGGMPSTSMNNTQIEAIANALKENTGATVIEGKVGDGNPNPHIRDSLT